MSKPIIGEIEHLQFLLNACNFPIFKNWRRKTISAVLIFDGFSDFFSLFFTGEWLFPELANLNDFTATLDSSKLKISSKFL